MTVHLHNRMLFSAAGGHGHLQPLLPLAEQAIRDGHEVLVTGAASLAEYVIARGLSFVATGPNLYPVHSPLEVRSIDEERHGLARHFVSSLGHARAKAVLDLCRSWQPDVVIRDEVDFGAAVAAEAAGLPHAAVVVIGAGNFIWPELVEEPLRNLSLDFGVDSNGVGILHRYLTLTPFPASFRDPADPLRGSVIPYQIPPRPRTVIEQRGRTAFVTLGTIFNTESGALLRTAALGAAESPAVEGVVVATGEHLDPLDLGHLPQHVVVHRFVQQESVLAQCDVVISHGGSGTVLGALKQALPMVSLAIGADQYLNAQRLDELGLGVSLRADMTDAGQIRDAVTEVIASESMRMRLIEVQNEILAMPSLKQAIRTIAKLRLSS